MRKPDRGLNGLWTEKLAIKGQNMEEKGESCYGFIAANFRSYFVPLLLQKHQNLLSLFKFVYTAWS